MLNGKSHPALDRDQRVARALQIRADILEDDRQRWLALSERAFQLAAICLREADDAAQQQFTMLASLARCERRLLRSLNGVRDGVSYEKNRV